MNRITELASASSLSDEASFDPIEDRLRAGVRATIEAMFNEEMGPSGLPAKSHPSCEQYWLPLSVW